jgi:hypothetical protein
VKYGIVKYYTIVFVNKEAPIMNISRIHRSGLWICAGVAVLGLAIASLAPAPSRADIVAEYLQLPSIAQPADTPSALNHVAFVRIYDTDANGRADAIVLFQDGVTAGGWSVLGKQLVDMAARRGKWIEVWMLDRREKNLEDRTGLTNAIAANDPSLAIQYYYGNNAFDTNGKFIATTPLGSPGASFIPLQQSDVPFMANWGVDVIFSDMETLLDLVPDQYRKTNVVLMGNYTGAYLVTSFAGHKLHDGNRGYQELAALVMMEGTPNPTSGVQPSPSAIASYVANVQKLRSGALPRYATDLSSGVRRDIGSMYSDLLPHSETIFLRATGAAGGSLADQFAAALRLTNLANSGFASSDDPIPGTFLPPYAIARGNIRAGRLDFTPVPGSPACVETSPGSGVCISPTGACAPPCVPPISQIDPNHVYDWLDGGAGNPGAAGNPLSGWTRTTPYPAAGSFTNAYVMPGEEPSVESVAVHDTYNNADGTNVEPVQVTFPTSGTVTLNSFPSHSYAWYLNSRFQNYDMTFIGTYQTVYIQDDTNNVHVDVDKTAVTGIPLISYVCGYQTAPAVNPFSGVDDFTAVWKDGTQQTAKAATVGPMDSRINTSLYKNGDFYYADNSLADQPGVIPGQDGANVVAASVIDWLIPRLGGSQIDVPSEVACPPSDQCHLAGMPDPATGLCSNPAAPNGTACNDANVCTLGDACRGGVCVGTDSCPTDKDQCKDGGWRSLITAAGQPFKNQGDCVSYVNTGK